VIRSQEDSTPTEPSHAHTPEFFEEPTAIHGQNNYERDNLITAVRLNVEQIQLVSDGGRVDLGRIGLQGA
jgi:hypothetical protein